MQGRMELSLHLPWLQPLGTDQQPQGAAEGTGGLVGTGLAASGTSLGQAWAAEMRDGRGLRHAEL